MLSYNDLGFSSAEEWYIYFLRHTKATPQQVADFDLETLHRRFGLHIDELIRLRELILNPPSNGNPTA